jgi:hypothetical protein
MENCAGCGFDLKGIEKFCPSCGNSVSADHFSYAEIILDITLHIFLEAIKTNLENPSVIKVGGASLDFYPYYVIEYKLEISKNDPSGKKHNIQNQEIVIVDAFNGELLSLSDKKRTKVVNKLNPFLSQRNADLASSNIAERNQIINDLKNIESIVNLKLHPAGRLCD